jgi:hypothetical protein
MNQTHFTRVGEAYVYGIMYGELTENVRRRSTRNSR